MAKTSLFARLRRLAEACHQARREGITDPAAIVASIRERMSRAAIPRRDAMRGMAAMLGAITVPACSTDGETNDDGGDTDGDGTPTIAIIGGGMAGIHCAYQLAQAGVTATVYEASERTGGRMYTAHDMFPDGQVIELGGELVDTGHLTLHMLAAEFSIQLDDRVEAAGAGVAGDVWWIEGVSVPDEVVVEQFSAVAPLMADLVTMADEDENVYAELDVISIRDWLTDNVPAATYPELNAILDNAYRGEYGLETDEQSSLNLLYLIGSDDPDPFRIFGVSDERYHTHNGSQTFPDTLAAEIPDQILTGHRLLSARDGAEGGYVLVFDTPDGELEVQADHVVFALPFTMLRQVDLADLGISEEKRTIINEEGYGTNAKIMGAFTSRVWIDDHASNGSVVTDLPFQQTWDTSLGQDGASGIITNFLGGDQGLASGEGTAEEWYTSVLLPGLEEVFPGVQAAYVADSAVRMHWPTHPFTQGSYACYRPGQWAFYGLEGAREGNLHFCGEHTSLEFQGYMEGAAETGALVAGAILEDLDMQASDLHRRILEVKRVVPQPAFSGRLPERPRPLARRRAIAAALAERLRPPGGDH